MTVSSPIDRVVAWRPLPFVAGGLLFALVMVWTFTATPRYRSTALLQLTTDDGSSALAGALSGIPGAPLLGLSKDGLETEMGVLRSRRILDAAIDSLALTVRRDEPAAGRDDVVQVRLVEGPEVEGELSFARDAAGRYSVSSSDLRPALALPTSLAPGDSFTLGSASIRLAPALAASEVAQFTLMVVPRYVARRALLDRFEVLRTSSGSQLVALTLDDADAQVAARSLEVIIAEYLRYTARSDRGDARYTVEELRRQIDAQSAALAGAEQSVRSFQERTGLVVPEEQAAAQVKRYAALRAQLDLLEVERDALAEMLALVRGRAAATSEGSGGRASSAYRQLATFPSLISNRAIQDLLVALTELENDRSALRLLRSEQNADVRQLTGRITEIETQLERLGAQYLEALDGQITPTRGALAEIDRELGALPEREMTLVRLLRDRTILNEGYLALQRQLRQTEVSDALRRDNVRVVDAPEAAHADDPYFPKPAVNFVLALVLAAATAGAVIAARSALAPMTPVRDLE